MIKDRDSDSGRADAEPSDAASSAAAGESDEELPHVVRPRDPSQLTSEERALLARYARDRPPHWD